MSLQRRLMVVLGLAAAVLIAGFATLGFALSSSESARVEEAQSVARDVADELVSALGRADVGKRPDADDLVLPARAALAGLPQVRGGYCGADGGIHAAVRGGRRNGRKPPTFSYEEQAALTSACREGASAPLDRVVRATRVTIVLATAPAAGGEIAWVALAVRAEPPSGFGWRASAMVLAAGTMILAMVVVSALASLRKGAAQLDAGITRLERDLRAPLEEPHAEELGAIARAVRSMARHLADAQDKEKKLAQELGHAQRLSALGRVVAGVAHEVRNPLAGVKLRLDLMKRDPSLGETAKGDVEACLEEVARLDRVVRSLLVVGRKEPRSVESLALGPIVDARLEACAPLAGERGVSVSRVGDATAFADPDAVGQIVENLARNAIEASPDGGAVEVVIARGASDADEVTLDVIDGGDGIPASRTAELFEPFFTTKPEGTGLGLWISRALAEAMGGSLGYARAPTEGGSARTRLRLTLRARPEPAREGAAKDETVGAA
jgi:signal transduction histidine kinase